MKKNTQWNEHAIAQAYDFGRPLDERVIQKLFEEIKRRTTHSFDRTVFLDQQCLSQNVTKCEIVKINIKER